MRSWLGAMLRRGGKRHSIVPWPRYEGQLNHLITAFVAGAVVGIASLVAGAMLGITLGSGEGTGTRAAPAAGRRVRGCCAFAGISPDATGL